jgi:hypothetical protein
MAGMAKVHVVAVLTAGLVAAAGLVSPLAQTKPKSAPATAAKIPASEIDGLMAPVALYPDQLLAQMLMSATVPAQVKELDKFVKANPSLKGSTLQDAARKGGFEPSLVALLVFPQVVDFMAVNVDWTTEVGIAFSSDRAGVFASIQRLREDAMKNGKLKSTAQQNVTTKTADNGEKFIVIEPANPQVVYVPQYKTETVYTQAPTTTTVIVQEDDDDAAEAMAAGLIGFTAGIAIGAAMDNNYYYGPYGWHGSPYMYNNGWDDFYDDREDAREDWYDNREDAREDIADHREDMAETRSDRAGNAQEQRTDRQENRTENRGSGANAQAVQNARASGTTSQRSQSSSSTRASTARSGTSSDAFSNYSSGRSERSASSRGKSSRSSSRSSGGRSRR